MFKIIQQFPRKTFYINKAFQVPIEKKFVNYSLFAITQSKQWHHIFVQCGCLRTRCYILLSEKIVALYFQNNKSRIIDYRKRKIDGFVFTSNLAESTVESLINKRCKGQQHMRWSRDGLDPLLQLRAPIYSDEWTEKWRSAVLSAAA